MRQFHLTDEQRYFGQFRGDDKPSPKFPHKGVPYTPEMSLTAIAWIGSSVNCPRCDDFNEGEPIERHTFTGHIGECDWYEIHECPVCGQHYEYKNGDY